MCGIWGFVGEKDTVNIADAWDGLCSIQDRGPDDWGLYVDGRGKLTKESTIDNAKTNVAFGNRRLSILDLSEAGNQPMSTPEGSWIVYNGEVYNYREIRDELREMGYEFHTGTDTEVILRAYEEYGSKCVERFRGMFAFAIYEPDGSVFLARDRFGIKPLYYEHSGDHLAFASELTALLDADIVAPELDPVGVDGFLTFGYVPGSETIVKGITSMPPGSTMKFNPKTGEHSINQYWEPSFGQGDNGNADRVRELLTESVKLRLRSDVPVGAFLSGGLDSSTIVALMRDLSMTGREDLHTYSVGFDQDSYSEADFAEAVADEFGTVHTTETITAKDVKTNLDDIIVKMDQPTIDGVNTYFVSQLAADDGVKVALSGLGSDELFYGYPSFESVPRRYRVAATLYHLPRSVRKSGAIAAARLARPLVGAGVSKITDALGSSDPFGAAYLSVRSLFSRRTRKSLIESDVSVDWAARIGDDIAETLDHAGSHDAVSDAELSWYMRDQLLRQTDTMSMAHSLEVRVPFLDTALAEYVTDSAPKSKREDEKGLLKSAVNDIVSPLVTDREKTGFEFPFAAWLQSDLVDVVDEALATDALENTPLSPLTVSTVRDQFEAGDVHWSRLWALVVLSLWINEHISDHPDRS